MDGAAYGRLKAVGNPQPEVGINGERKQAPVREGTKQRLLLRQVGRGTGNP